MIKSSNLTPFASIFFGMNPESYNCTNQWHQKNRPWRSLKWTRMRCGGRLWTGAACLNNQRRSQPVCLNRGARTIHVVWVRVTALAGLGERRDACSSSLLADDLKAVSCVDRLETENIFMKSICRIDTGSLSNWKKDGIDSDKNVLPAVFRFRIRIGNPDPDPGGQKWATKILKN
jgi:hypothetical protein